MIAQNDVNRNEKTIYRISKPLIDYETRYA